MLNARHVNREPYILPFMTGNRVLSVGDIAKETRLTRQHVWHLAVTGAIPAERANPGGKQYRFYESPRLTTWIKEKAAYRPPVSQERRCSRISRRRREKIEKLLEILENKTEVSAQDKETALSYFSCLFVLWWARWMNPERRIPLLEGIHALYESKLIFGHGLKMDFLYLDSEIKRLPTVKETTPQTEQSCVNASAERQTKPRRHARHKARDNY